MARLMRRSVSGIGSQSTEASAVSLAAHRALVEGYLNSVFRFLITDAIVNAS